MQRNILNAGILVALSQQAEAATRTGSGNGSSKPPKFAKKEYDLDTKVVSVEFGNGTTLELDVSSLPQEMQTQLMLHGAAQKIGDSYAGVKGNFSEGIANAQGVIDQLKAGEWRGAGDEARPRLAELAEAIARIKGVDLERSTAAVEKASDEQRKTWRSNAGVKATIAKIRAEKAAKALEAAGESAQEVEVNFGE